MGRSDEPSSKPRELVHRAQLDCKQWYRRLRRARRGRGKLSYEEAVREWHDAVMTYYEEIKRFRQNEPIQEEWHQEVVFDGETLESLSNKRLTSEISTETETDPDTNVTQEVRRQQPWTMTPNQSLAVYDQLDKCANALGFDAEANSKDPVTGAGEKGDPEEMDHLNANPLEVSASGDD